MTLDEKHADAGDGPLAGTRVLELSQFIGGPICGCILADHGADVIKIERPDGEDGRRIAPLVNGESLYYATYNRNKRGMTLDLGDARDRALFLRLVENADVVVENFRPGVLERFGLAYDVLARTNPRIILVSISGFGQDGPYRDVPAFDQIVQALSGVMFLNGESGAPPMKLGISISDYASGLQGAIGALLALAARERSGHGQHVDVALFDSLVFMMETAVAHVHATGEPPPRVGNGRPGSVPGSVYPCEDGWVYIAGTSDRIWERLVGELAPAADLASLLATNEARVNNRDLVDKIVSAWSGPQPVKQVLDRLEAARVPCAPVRSVEDLMADAQIRARDMLVEVDHPVLGPHIVPGVPVKLSQDPGRALRRAPLLGEHNDVIFRELLGLEPEQVQALREAGTSPAAGGRHPP